MVVASESVDTVVVAVVVAVVVVVVVVWADIVVCAWVAVDVEIELAATVEAVVFERTGSWSFVDCTDLCAATEPAAVVVAVDESSFDWNMSTNAFVEVAAEVEVDLDSEQTAAVVVAAAAWDDVASGACTWVHRPFVASLTGCSCSDRSNCSRIGTYYWGPFAGLEVDEPYVAVHGTWNIAVDADFAWGDDADADAVVEVDDDDEPSIEAEVVAHTWSCRNSLVQPADNWPPGSSADTVGDWT